MSERRFFGTDGMRGKAGVWPITPDVILRFALSSGEYFKREGGSRVVVIGKDTRLSGYMVEAALEAGFTAMGFKVYLVGPLPTPAIAFLTKSLRADLGVMVSASHNGFADNGIKFFGPDGYKLPDEVELAIETGMERDPIFATERELGKAKRLDDASGRYLEHAKSSFPKDLTLKGLRVVVDCAHGAGYKVAPSVLWELGAEIIPVAVSPSGSNINHGCGATHPAYAREVLLREKADVAVILDGDADRIVMIDEKGSILDGDAILGMLARHFKEWGTLRGDAVVATQMSNLGLERFIHGLGLEFLRTKVGDRYVIEVMRQHGLNLGGEPSGHVIIHDYASTGDGIIAALQVLAIMQGAQHPLSELACAFERVPQFTHNLTLKKPLNLEKDEIVSLIARAKSRLGENGYLLIRSSGTEPLLRFMAQGDNEDLLKTVILDLAEAIQSLSLKT